MMRRLGTLAMVATAVMLTACTTSSSPAPSRATPKEISAFLSLAQKGFHSEFSATYRTVDTLSITGRHIPVAVTAVQMSWPLSETLAPAHFKYEQSGGTKVFFGAFRSSYSVPGEYGQDYTCFSEHHATWSCSQIGDGTIGSMLMGAYLPLNTLSGLQALAGGFTYPTLPRAAYFSRKIVLGRRLTCLNFPSAKRPRATVCLTAGGIIGYYSSQVRASSEGPLGTTSLVSLSFHVTRAELTLPAKARAASGA
jgi:hypothetical protein